MLPAAWRGWWDKKACREMMLNFAPPCWLNNSEQLVPWLNQAEKHSDRLFLPLQQRALSNPPALLGGWRVLWCSLGTPEAFALNNNRLRKNKDIRVLLLRLKCIIIGTWEETRPARPLPGHGGLCIYRAAYHVNRNRLPKKDSRSIEEALDSFKCNKYGNSNLVPLLPAIIHRPNHSSREQQLKPKPFQMDNVSQAEDQIKWHGRMREDGGGGVGGGEGLLRSLSESARWGMPFVSI